VKKITETPNEAEVKTAAPCGQVERLASAFLCYMDGNFAFFTTQELAKQWGDDWNDAPYEHNAGEPYGPTVFYKETGPENDPKDWNEDGTPKWEIIKMAWDGPFDPPCESHSNSPWSVAQINAGAVAWLTTSRWLNNKDDTIAIYAGVDIAEFKRLVELGGGAVYSKC
jgi:hypothetical protein